ncbi:MAG: NAD(P)H-dependent glycerol-3-phosphate dehydrogenase [Chitinophagaceae bacterium]
MTFGILGSGSWATALAKILTDNNHHISWLFRNEESIRHVESRHHNPHYLSSAYFNTSLLSLTTDAAVVINNSDCIIIAIPSAFADKVLSDLDKNIFEGKKIISAIKGILPEQNLLLNDYLKQEFNVPLENYFAVLGPCHAEEVATEKLSYLTFSGIDEEVTTEIASHFRTSYLNTVENNDIYGVQFAAILKNIYALGAGIAHGLDYGDNFQSVLIANSADEMAGFLRKAGIQNIEVGNIEHSRHNLVEGKHKPANYAASVYLGDLLVTCYSLYSRNRTFGTMIGKGYSVTAAKLEMNMVAEGYNASKCMHIVNENIEADMPIANTVYEILWKQLPAREGFKRIETTLI